MKDVHIDDRATIAGKRNIQVNVRQSRFARPRFYVHQAVWFAAAMLVGWLSLVLFPGFFQATTQAVGSGWSIPALGVGVLAGIPVVIIVAGITLLGLPIALTLFALYLATSTWQSFGLEPSWAGPF